MALKILPHGRLQEWVAEEQGYFAAEGLEYTFPPEGDYGVPAGQVSTGARSTYAPSAPVSASSSCPTPGRSSPPPRPGPAASSPPSPNPPPTTRPFCPSPSPPPTDARAAPDDAAVPVSWRRHPVLVPGPTRHITPAGLAVRGCAAPSSCPCSTPSSSRPDSAPGSSPTGGSRSDGGTCAAARSHASFTKLFRLTWGNVPRV